MRKKLLYELRAYVTNEDFNQMKREALARETNLSQAIRECLKEYFGLRAELATSIEIPQKITTENQPKIIHVLLARTEATILQRLREIEKKVDGVVQKT